MPGRIARCWSAIAAVRDRRGSTTTSRPPRSRRARSRRRTSGTVHSDPLDIKGLEPSRTSRSVRSMSGTGIANGSPNTSAQDRCLGIWSSVLAEATNPGRSAVVRAFTYSCPASVWTFGLPR